MARKKALLSIPKDEEFSTTAEAIDEPLAAEPAYVRLPRSQRLADCIQKMRIIDEGWELHVERTGGTGVQRGACGSFVTESRIAFPEDILKRFGSGEYHIIAISPDESDDGECDVIEMNTPVLLGEPPAAKASEPPPRSGTDNLIMAMMQQNTQILTSLISTMGNKQSIAARAEADVAQANLKYAERLQSEVLKYAAKHAGTQGDALSEVSKVFELMDTLQERGLSTTEATASDTDNTEGIAEIAKQVGPVVLNGMQEYFRLRREQMAIDAAAKGVAAKVVDIDPDEVGNSPLVGAAAQ